MIDPSYALNTLLGDMLAANATVAQHVPPASIRAGSIRPDHMPALVLAPARIRVLGRASGNQIVGEVRMILNIWTPEDGSLVAQELAGAVLAALMDAPATSGFAIDEWDRPELVWMRDPDPARSFAHGVVALRAVLRWRAD